jgi:hypothetical protein
MQSRANNSNDEFEQQAPTKLLKPVPVLALEEFEGEPVGIETPSYTGESFEQKFLRSRLDQTKDYPLPIPIINIVQNSMPLPLLTLKSFSLWQGKQKSKKTTVLALAVAAFIRGGNDYADSVYFSGAMDGSVLFFDNEQGESYAARTMKLILKLAGVESTSRFQYCDLREFPPQERKAIIEAGIKYTPDVKLVVIDGLVDLMDDFMDAAEGHLTATEILKLCSIYNIHVAGVLHQNKADKNARAHIGTISSQKCEIEIATEVDPDDTAQSIVTCVNSRGVPFEPFAIRWDKGSLPCINQEYNALSRSDPKANKQFERSREIAEYVFKPLAALTHTEAINGIMNAAQKSKSTAKRYLDDFLEWGFIEHGPNGNYRIKQAV